MRSILKLLLYTLTIMLSNMVNAQEIKGKITDEEGGVIPFVNIMEKGTEKGVISDDNGNFIYSPEKFPVILVFSYIGFNKLEKKVKKKCDINIIMKGGSVLDEIVLTGSRSKPRTKLNSSVPIDNISVAELKTTGQVSLDQMLNYSIPSFNSSNQTVSDATAHFDPADLRGLGPSRTLVLINGKRKNQSALLYFSETPGKGEVGTDMKSIPASSIYRVEVLRDGASSQYGSDAIAGVVNIILKNKKHTEINFSSGITNKADGINYGADINHTFELGKRGFINTSLSGYSQDYTNRASKVGSDKMFGTLFNNQSLIDGTHPFIKENPSLGMIIGQPEMKIVNLFTNAEYKINENTNIYAFGGYNIRKGKSFSVYRAPYWIKDPHNLLHKEGTEYKGFQPTFKTNISDVYFTTGSKFKLIGFDADLSTTYGRNEVGFIVGNTLNTSMGENSPTNFDAGGFTFSNTLGNFDMNKSFDNISLGFGVEARQEQFRVISGEKASYQGGGPQSYSGSQPSDELSKKRYNIGVYATLDYDITDNFLIGGATRYENFSDFGGNTSFKLSSRYKLGKTVFRGSFGTGFRAPSLHQIYSSNVQTLVSNNTISNQGTFNNISPIIKQLGVAPLFAETSENISAGLTFNVLNNFSISLDYYKVRVNDRVLFTGQIVPKDDNGNINATVQKILNTNNITSARFFINAVNTITQGFDYTMNYRNIKIFKGKLALNSCFNFNVTTLEGKIKVPKKLEAYSNSIFNRKEQARLTSSRPKMKFLLGGIYKIGKFIGSLNNTYFGQVEYRHEIDPNKDQVFSGKIITDLYLGYKFSKMISINLSVNNLFDVYPDTINPKGDFFTNLGGRFKYPWEVNQFGFNGMSFKTGITLKF